MQWYEKYEKLTSALFTLENSGRKIGEAPPYHAKRNADYDIEDIEGLYGMNQVFKIVGYTLDPPFPVRYPAVAIMFEDQQTFEKIWWHYLKD